MIDKLKWQLLKVFKKLFLWRNPNIEIGSFTYGIPNVLFGKQEKTKLRIGKYCSIPHKRMTFLLGGEHPPQRVSTFPFNMEFKESKNITGLPMSKGDIIVGNDVWFGINSMILSGVTIGDGAIIGSGALVTKNVPPYAVVGGVPAKIIYYRFTEEQIKTLLTIEWWKWPKDKVRECSPALMSENIDEFISHISNNDIR